MVAPSILSADFANLEKEIKAIATAGADWVHVDVMDGHFVPNITIGIPVVKSLKKISPLPLDVHLMIDEPEKYVEQFVKAGSDYLTIHVESTKDPAAVLKNIRALGAKAGITLRPRTSVQDVLPLLSLCDLVLVMTVEPGFGGQSFMHDQIAKISALRAEISKQNLKCLIEVDGGINAETALLCHEADVFVAGSYVFGNDYKSAIWALKDGKLPSSK
ncbi:ribulose-phosphate 3-epimerase [Bdellovibrio sp. NC01]|uniref:ribulose-phosphate 3-epimerase n=1 Tax=Bdellovibrio sp. NC01 TaxID=2220073 RepID=UPI00115AA241|nr:ribulose-phosphate 3-epimerase [Bdellovibrio sp. NC01]